MAPLCVVGPVSAMSCCKQRGGQEPHRFSSFAVARDAEVLRQMRDIVKDTWAEWHSAAPGSLHPQCILDFDRSEYTVGERHFGTGSAATAGNLVEATVDFAQFFIQVCGSTGLAYVASAIASQMSMAVLGTACYSGPHSYAVPSGVTVPSYTIHRRGKDVVIGLRRVSERFEHFCLPGDDPIECSRGSYIKQNAQIVLRAAGARAPRVSVANVTEEVRFRWPDGSVVVRDGLRLDFKSPPAGAAKRRTIADPLAATLMVALVAVAAGQYLSPRQGCGIFEPFATCYGLSELAGEHGASELECLARCKAGGYSCCRVDDLERCRGGSARILSGLEGHRAASVCTDPPS